MRPAFAVRAGLLIPVPGMVTRVFIPLRERAGIVGARTTAGRRGFGKPAVVSAAALALSARSVPFARPHVSFSRPHRIMQMSPPLPSFTIFWRVSCSFCWAFSGIR